MRLQRLLRRPGCHLCGHPLVSRRRLGVPRKLPAPADPRQPGRDASGPRLLPVERGGRLEAPGEAQVGAM